MSSTTERKEDDIRPSRFRRWGMRTLTGSALLLGLALAGPAPSAHATLAGFNSVAGSNAWVDFNGDGRADTCLLMYGNTPQCTVSTGGGFGQTFSGPTIDAGYSAGRAWTDVNGDGKADFCRVVGGWYKYVQCTLSTGSGFTGNITSQALDPGYDAGRAWADVDGDGKADYCRVVGGWDKRVQCTLSTGSGWSSTLTSGVLDPGYDAGRAWVDANGDGRADYCRVVGLGTLYVQCTLSTGDGFGQTITSQALDAGYDDSRRWADVNGDGRADYCRIVGSVFYAWTNVRCTVSIGDSAEFSFTSPTMDAGYTGTGTWADFNGDGKADYCRETNSTVGRCTLSTGTGFGDTVVSGSGPIGNDGWVDVNGDGRADWCRRTASNGAVCALSNGNAFGMTIVGSW